MDYEDVFVYYLLIYVMLMFEFLFFVDGKFFGFNFKVRESEELKFVNYLVENIKDIYGWNVLEEFLD